jgi:hypothetical protein
MPLSTSSRFMHGTEVTRAFAARNNGSDRDLRGVGQVEHDETAALPVLGEEVGGLRVELLDQLPRDDRQLSLCAASLPASVSMTASSIIPMTASRMRRRCS